MDAVVRAAVIYVFLLVLFRVTGVLVVLPEAVVVYYKVQRHRHKEQQEVFETCGQPVEEQIADEGGVDGFTH